MLRMGVVMPSLDKMYICPQAKELSFPNTSRTRRVIHTYPPRYYRQMVYA